jgi:hypothetical protein
LRHFRAVRRPWPTFGGSAAASSDPVELALAKALAAVAGRLYVVALLAKELEARRLARAKVFTLDDVRAKRR